MSQALGHAFCENRPLPSGKQTKSYGKSPCLMGKSTISMAIFNGYVTNYPRVCNVIYGDFPWGFSMGIQNQLYI
jgi:hypothetical protein